MNLMVVGMGRVGLVAAAALADFGHTVFGVDIDQARIVSLAEGQIPFFEPGLAELVQKNLKAGRLTFSSALSEPLRQSAAVFLAVGTEEISEGNPNLGALSAVAEEVVRSADEYKILVIKSTVPVGTAARLRERLKAIAHVEFDIVSNPEFLREGSAIENFLRPDRVVIGGESERALALVESIYRPLYLLGTPIVSTNHETAELIKYATNAFLAAKITLINEFATLCDALGANVHAVARAVGLDKRIGPKFLHPGPGWGGACLPKDTRTLVQMAKQYGCSMPLVEGVLASNSSICGQLVTSLLDGLENRDGQVVCVLGLAYKPFTDDVRESPALEFISRLLAQGVTVRAHDPMANQEAAKVLPHPALSFHSNPFVAARAADAVAVLTEWNEFRSFDLDQLRRAMRGNVLLDTRNVYEPGEAIKHGFLYLGRGQGRLRSAPKAAATTG